MKPIYDLFLKLYPLGARIVALRNRKAKQWLKGQANAFDQLTGFEPSAPVIWMHCSSLGEFEQGRPVLESLRDRNPSLLIVLSFFSPSGYEPNRNYKGADLVVYLPLDSPQNARRFVDLVKPSLVLFVKYEFWYYYIREIERKGLPLLLVSGIFRSSQPFFHWWGSFHREMLRSFKMIFLQDKQSSRLLNQEGFTNHLLAGDTRFDRVLKIRKDLQPIDKISSFADNKKVIVAGSTWASDDESLKKFVKNNTDIRFIIAPHDVSPARIKQCLEYYPGALLLSNIDAATAQLSNVLIIDRIGLLSRLYHYGDICFVGGGFDKDGVHNVLEAAVYGKPVLFGPVYNKYAEAVGLVKAGGGFPCKDTGELETQLSGLLNDKEKFTVAAAAAKRFVEENAGATARIVDYVQANRLLTT